jgi:pimeloyl-ACP methyl ester carboxylesterase
VLTFIFQLREREACIRNLRKVNVKGGHHVHLDDPEEILPHILSFFRETAESCESTPANPTS